MNYLNVVQKWLPAQDRGSLNFYRQHSDIVEYQGPATLFDIPADFVFDGDIVYEVYGASPKQDVIHREHDRVVLQGISYALFRFEPTTPTA